MKRHQSNATALRISNMEATCDLEVTNVRCLQRMVAIFRILISNLNFINDTEENKVLLL